jgi:tetratricopeptide (TPR) repeat protein
MIGHVAVCSALFAIGLLLPLRGSAQAVRVYGVDSDARQCFDSARRAVTFGETTPFARRSCTTALANELQTGDRAATHVNRGILSMALKKYPNALGDFEAAMVLHPEYGAIYVNRGNVFFIHDRYVSAIAEYTRALAAEMDEYQVAYLNRGMAHEVLGDLEAAEADYRRALELAPEWGLAISKLARVLAKQH